MKNSDNRRARFLIACLSAILVFAATSCVNFPGKRQINSTFKDYENVRPSRNDEPGELLMYVYGHGPYVLMKSPSPRSRLQIVGYFANASGINGWLQLKSDTNLPYFVESIKGKIIERDPNMFLAILADTGLDRNKIYISTSTGEGPDIDDILYTQLYYMTPERFSESPDYIPGGENGNALGWTLSVLADYGYTESTWKNKNSYRIENERYYKSRASDFENREYLQTPPELSIRDFLAVALSRPLDWGPNAGMNENYGIAKALREHRLALAKQKKELSKKKDLKVDPYSIKMEGEWKEAQKRIDRIAALAKKNQLDDGTFSSSWSESKKNEKNVIKRAIVTGRILDTLSEGLSDKQLEEKWVAGIIDGLSKLLISNKAAFSMDPYAMGYALHAMRNYRDRMPGAPVIKDQQGCDSKKQVSCPSAATQK